MMANIFKVKFSICITIVFSFCSHEQVLASDADNGDLLLNRNVLKLKKELEITEAVEEQLCALQKNLTKHSIHFLDSSARVPSGILLGNINSFGQYEECISLKETVEGVSIRGKYCMMEINFEIEDNATLPEGITGKFDGLVSGLVGTCVPNACHLADLSVSLLPGVTVTGKEIFCRHMNDKPFAAQDIVAIVAFSVLGLLVIVSSAYEMCRKLLYNEDTQITVKSFSVYHNVNKLTRISKTVNPLSCANGIRALSMAWIIISHTYATQLLIAKENNVVVLKWSKKFHSTWIAAATMAVDTFLCLAGFLLTWSVLKKFNQPVLFLKSVPLLYLHRYLRLTPLLVAVILLQVSFFNHVSDGPDWRLTTKLMNDCLDSWWITLLNVQNYVRSEDMCLPHTWYLAVDMQLYIFAPLVIIFLLNGTKRAVVILTVVLLAAQTLVLVYTYSYNFYLINEKYVIDLEYKKYYLFNTLTRSSPFILGIIVAYITSTLKKREVQTRNKFYILIHWIATGILLILPFYGTHLIFSHTIGQNSMNFINAWHKISWTLGVGGIIFACVNGFGGPVHWFLSLKMWTVPARLSYAAYLIQFPIMFSVSGSAMKPICFDDGRLLFKAVAFLGIVFFAAFVMYVVVEAPFNELANLLLAKIVGENNRSTEIVNRNEFQPPLSMQVDEVKHDVLEFKNRRKSKENITSTVRLFGRREENLNNGD